MPDLLCALPVNVTVLLPLLLLDAQVLLIPLSDRFREVVGRAKLGEVIAFFSCGGEDAQVGIREVTVGRLPNMMRLCC